MADEIELANSGNEVQEGRAVPTDPKSPTRLGPVTPLTPNVSAFNPAGPLTEGLHDELRRYILLGGGRLILLCTVVTALLAAWYYYGEATGATLRQQSYVITYTAAAAFVTLYCLFISVFR